VVLIPEAKTEEKDLISRKKKEILHFLSEIAELVVLVGPLAVEELDETAALLKYD
jgi:hypothetical protein